MNADDIAVMFHTGGTTGDPKGVMLTNRNIVSEMWHMLKTTEYTDFRKTTVITVLPPFVSFALVNCILEPLVGGMRIVIIPKYKPTKLIDYIKKYNPQHIMSIPPYWEVLLTDSRSKSTDFSCIENAFYGGEVMAMEKKAAIDKIIEDGNGKAKLFCGYGMTEVTGCICLNYYDCNSEGSSGIPLINANCSIVDFDNKELKYGQEGEICFSGPTVMKGYFKNKQATDDMIKLHPDGEYWLHTGDVGYVDVNGEIYITGREKRIIITKDLDGVPAKLFPDRVEKVISGCDGVKECCVVEKQDEARVNVPIAFVCFNNNENDDKVNEIRERCRKELPDYMYPEEIRIINELPRTSRGKVDYRKLIDEITKK